MPLDVPAPPRPPQRTPSPGGLARRPSTWPWTRLGGALLTAFALLPLPVPPGGEAPLPVAAGGTVALAAALWLALGGPDAARPRHRAGYGLLALALVLGLGLRLDWDPRGLLDLSPLVPVLPLLLLGTALPAPRGLRVGAVLLALAVAGHPAVCATLDRLPVGPTVERSASLVVAALLALHGMHALGARGPLACEDEGVDEDAALGSAAPAVRWPRASVWIGGLLSLLLWGGAELARAPGHGPEPDDDQVAWARALPARVDCGPSLAALPVRGTVAPSVPADAARLVWTRARDGRRRVRELALEDGAFHGALPPGSWIPGVWDARLELSGAGQYLGYRAAGRVAVGGSRLGLALAVLLVAASRLGRHAGRASLVVLVAAVLAVALGVAPAGP